MPVPSPRNKILPARGNYADLLANVASILDGEICYAIDQDQYYQNEGGTLVAVGATKAQGLLADSALQPGDEVVQSVAGRTGDVVLTSSDVGLGNVDNTSDADKPVSTATQSALDLKADLVNGVVPNSQLPSIAITEYLGEAADEAAMLALDGQKGDWCIRTDLNNTWVVTGDDPSVIGGWTQLATPADLVTSVNGYQGAVVLSASDVGLSSTDDLSEGSTNLYSQWDDVTGGINYAGGLVGIGEANPVVPLHITATGATPVVVESTNSQSLINFRNSSTELFYMGASSNNWNVQTNGVERLSVTTAGDVGIGTDSPNFPLDVNGNVGLAEGQVIAWHDGSGSKAGDIYIDSSDNIVFRNTSNVTERMRIDSSGRLLLGRTSASDSTQRILVENDPTANTACYVNINSGSASNSGVLFGDSDLDYQAGILYNHSDEALRFFKFGFTEAARIDSSGKVGIGTTSPAQLLEIASTAPNIRFTDTVDGYSEIDGNAASLKFNADKGNTKADSNIIFAVDNNERMRLDSSGRLLIGTSTARGNFFNSIVQPHIQLEGATDFSRQSAIISSSSTAPHGAVQILAHQKSGSIGGNTLVAANDAFGMLSFQGSDGTQFVEGARIEAWADGIPGANSMAGRLVFSTTVDAASSPTERMRIDSNGRLLVSTISRVQEASGTETGATFYTTGTLVLGADNDRPLALKRYSSDGAIAQFRRDNALVGSISVTTTATSYNESSDYRLKENVVDIFDGIERLKQLQPRRFNFIVEPGTTVDGFIAHEVQEVIPEAVTGAKDEVDAENNPVMQGIDKSKLVPLLTAALQEAITKIESLEQRLTDAGL